MFIQEKIDKLLPYLRGFAFDEKTMYVRFTVLFPNHWDITYLKNKSILLGVIGNNGVSTMYLIGTNTVTDLSEHPILEDKPIDYFFEEIEKVINFNGEKERKEELLKEKIAELQKLFNEASLEDVQKMQIIKKSDYEPVPFMSSGSTDFNLFIPKIEIPEQAPDFPNDFFCSVAIVEKDYMEDNNLFNGEVDDENGNILDDEDINLPGIVKEMIRFNNNTEGGDIPTK